MLCALPATAATSMIHHCVCCIANCLVRRDRWCRTAGYFHSCRDVVVGWMMGGGTAKVSSTNSSSTPTLWRRRRGRQIHLDFTTTTGSGSRVCGVLLGSRRHCRGSKNKFEFRGKKRASTLLLWFLKQQHTQKKKRTDSARTFSSSVTRTTVVFFLFFVFVHSDNKKHIHTHTQSEPTLPFSSSPSLNFNCYPQCTAVGTRHGIERDHCL